MSTNEHLGCSVSDPRSIPRVDVCILPVPPFDWGKMIDSWIEFQHSRNEDVNEYPLKVSVFDEAVLHGCV